MHVAVIIAAGGRGARMGRALPKQWLTLNGQTILERTLAAFDRHQQVQELVIVVPPDTLTSAEFVKPALTKPTRYVAGGARRQDSVANGVAALSPEVEVVLVHDAARPLVTASLISRTIAAAAEFGAAIAALPVHDTVKQVVRERHASVDERTIRPAGQAQAIQPGLPATTAPATGDLASTAPAAPAAPAAPVAAAAAADRAFIERTLPRETLFLAQTPQGFRRAVLDDAIAQSLARGDEDATDEACLAERAGYRVAIVAGDPDNLKITTEHDLARADALTRSARPDAAVASGTSGATASGTTASGASPGSASPGAATTGDASASDAPTVISDAAIGAAITREALEGTVSAPLMRIGLGYDLHRLVEGRPLILGGVRIPFERGLLGHSDADAVSHAVTDALLGAANLGDIGRLFPDTDPQWKDANSLRLLADAWSRVRAGGFTLGNLDIVVIAQKPKISPHADAIRDSLARVLDVSRDAIAIKGKTNEGVDAIGHGDAIAVHVVALLVR